MLTNISVNSLSGVIRSRPGSAALTSVTKRSEAKYENKGSTNNSSNQMEGFDSVFLNNDKIILPVKEYSNKFLRENKPREDLIYSKNVMKPKKSIIFHNKGKKVAKGFHNVSTAKNKENNNSSYSHSRNIKTETSISLSRGPGNNQNTSAVTSSMNEANDLAYLKNNANIIQQYVEQNKVSTSRALEMFSKVFKQEGIERMRIRKQFVNKTSDVHVKQVTLQEKVEKEKKIVQYPSTTVSNQNNLTPNKSSGYFQCLNSQTSSNKVHRNKFMSCEKKRNTLNSKNVNFSASYWGWEDDENFQLAGW